MKLHTHTEPGGKVVNEDFLIVRRHPLAEDVSIGVLADGQGGRSNAALAARTACETVWARAAELALHQLFDGGMWSRIIEHADEAVVLSGGFTTLVAFPMDRDSAAGASVGDSKAYFMLPSSEDVAEWTVKQRKNPPLGSGSVDAVTFMCPAIGGGRLLVVSDGVWKYCGDDALRSSFSQRVEAVADHLRTALVQRSGSALPDDFSLIAIDVG